MSDIRRQYRPKEDLIINIKSEMIGHIAMDLEEKDDLEEKLKEFAAFAIEKWGDRLIYAGDIAEGMFIKCGKWDVDGVPVRLLESWDVIHDRIHRRLDVLGYPPEAVICD